MRGWLWEKYEKNLKSFLQTSESHAWVLFDSMCCRSRRGSSSLSSSLVGRVADCRRLQHPFDRNIQLVEQNHFPAIQDQHGRRGCHHADAAQSIWDTVVVCSMRYSNEQ